MALIINSNITSLNAQRQLMSSNIAQQQAGDNLASGKRINSAADDAAGLSLSSRMTSKIRALDQVIRNANDGISLIQTAEGALDESTNILQRMRQLAVESSNGVYSGAQRNILDAEVKQLVAELDRIAQNTTFNGEKILDGSQSSIDLQVGAEKGETISFNIGAADSSTLGLASTSADLSGDATADLTGVNATDNTPVTFAYGDIQINGQGLSAFNGATQRLQDIIHDINTNISGVSASGYNMVQAGTMGDGIIHANDVLTLSVFNATDNTQTDFTVSGTSSLDELVNSINTKTGGLVNASVDSTGKLVLNNETGASIGLSYENTASGSGYTLASVLGIRDADAMDQGGQVPSNTGEFVAGADHALLFTGHLALSSDDNSTISITKGVNGTDADLASLGFRETSSGEVKGIALEASAQGTALAAGDLVINGTAIGATTGSTSVIDTSTITVPAGAAQITFTPNSSVEVTAQGAYVPGPTSYGELHLGSVGATAATPLDLSSNNGFTVGFRSDPFSFSSAVVFDKNYDTRQSIVDDINTQLAGQQDIEAYLDVDNKLAFRATSSLAHVSLSPFTVVFSNPQFNGQPAFISGTANTLLGFDIENPGNTDLYNSLGNGIYVWSPSVSAVGFSINGTDIDLDAADDDGTITAVEIADAVNTASGTTGVTAYVDADDQLHFASDSAFTLANDANQSGFINSLDSGAGLGAGSYSQSFSEVHASSSVVDLDMSGGAANEVQFAVDDGTANTTVTLDQNYADLAAMVTDINVDLSAAGNTVEAYTDENGRLAFRKTTSSNGGDFTVTSGTVGGSANFTNSTGLSTGTTASATRTGSVFINGYEVTGIDHRDANAAVQAINAQQANTGVLAVLGESNQISLFGTSTITFTVGNTNGIATGKALGLNFVDSDNNGVLDVQTVSSTVGEGSSTVESIITAQGFQGKIEAINAVTETTGVVARALAQESYRFDHNAPVEVAARNAYVAGATSFEELHFGGNAVGSIDLSGLNREFAVDISDGTNTATVTFDNNYTSAQELIDDINGNFLVPNGINITAYLDGNNKLAFRGTAADVDITLDNFTPGSAFVTGDASTLLGFSPSSASSFTGAAVGFSINGNDIQLEAADDDGSITATEIAAAVNASSVTTGVIAYVDKDDKLHFASDAAFTLGEDSNQTGFVNRLDTGGSLVTGSHGRSFSEVHGLAAVTDFDMSGGTINQVQLVVDDGTANTTVTLDQNYGNLATMVADINVDLSFTGNTVQAYADESGYLAFRKTTASNSGNFTVTSGTVGASASFTNSTGLLTGATASAARTGSVFINGYEVTGINNSDINAAMATINAAQVNTGITATLDKNGEIQLKGNASITLAVGDTNGLATGKVLGIDFADADNNGLIDPQRVNASIDLRSVNAGSPISLELNANAAIATGLKDLNSELSASLTGSALSGISLSTQEAAQQAITSIDVALETINTTRSELGAISNRLEFTVSNVANIAENTSIARSRIVDANFAAETAALSRSQILQQASQAIVAQANIRPRQALELLS